MTRMNAETMGEALERQGLPEVMCLVVDLAEAVGRIPVGEWHYVFGSDHRWQAALNGGLSNRWRPDNTWMPVPRFHVAFMFNGWPAGLVSPAGGRVIGITEAKLCAALEAEVSWVQVQKLGCAARAAVYQG